MWATVVVCAFACCGDGLDTDTPSPSESLIAELKQTLQTGSLIFSQGDCLAVRIFSQSSYTHVGGVVEIENDFIVYDSMNGVGVRKTPLEEYVRQQTPGSIRIVHPAIAFTDDQITSYVTHLESQLGRMYAVKHHLTGSRSDGLHCSEYMTDALVAADLITAKQPSRVSPGSLLEGVTASNVYLAGNGFELNAPEPAPQTDDATWYQRAWRSTSGCCSKSATKMRRWVLCR